MGRKLELELNEDTGSLKYYGARIVLSQESFYSRIQKAIESTGFAGLAHRMMYENGEQSTFEAVSAAEKAFISTSRILVKRKLIERLLLLALERGFGLLRLGSFDYASGKGTVLIENSVVARTYGKSAKSVCFLLCGILSGAAQIVYGGCFICEENQCSAVKGAICEFSLKPCSQAEREKFLKKLT